MVSGLPNTVPNVVELERLLSEPTEAAVAAMRQLPGDVVVLGAGGKMGPSLLRMLRRASDEAGRDRRIFAVSRFSDDHLVQTLEAEGFDVVRGSLLDESFVQRLPEAPNVVCMTGRKFGTSGSAGTTWATNVILPALVCQRYAGRRIVAFSTGNVYPLVPVDSGGSVEGDELGPVGEYGMAALGRERVFEYFSEKDGTPVSLVRLNYAVEMRYGVLVDLARKVLEGRPIDVSMGYANVVWQADANAAAIAALADASVPPHVVNVTGPELLDVRETCRRLGELLGRDVELVGEPGSTALLNDASYAHARYGSPRVALDRLIDWTADWLRRGEPTWDKATHFEVRDGRF